MTKKTRSPRASSSSRKSGSKATSASTGRRSYRQFCGVARALDRIGERWTLLIVRNLLLGPRRYSDLLAELPGITTNLLAKRLAELSQLGLLEREELPPPLSATVYRLTPLGASLEPVIMELGRWGSRFLSELQPGDTLNIGWGLLSAKRRYVGGMSFVAELVIDERHFELAFSPTYLSVQERPAVRAQVCVKGSLSAFRGWLFLGQSADALLARSALTVAGEAAAFECFKAALALPS